MTIHTLDFRGRFHLFASIRSVTSRRSSRTPSPVRAEHSRHLAESCKVLECIWVRSQILFASHKESKNTRSEFFCVGDPPFENIIQSFLPLDGEAKENGMNVGKNHRGKLVVNFTIFGALSELQCDSLSFHLDGDKRTAFQNYGMILLCYVINSRTRGE